MPTDLPFSRLTHLGDMPVETFLREYWQKKPLLIRQAIPNFQSPVSADELAGFALESDVVSRLIIESAPSKWQLEHGPLAEDRFSRLPARNWTLLVQHADLLDPDINALLEAFRFIPRWRLDDIMISYATDGGGVGPHFDYYDVFLLQAGGRRRWRTGQTCNSESPLLAGQELKILEDFDTVNDWETEPGDLVYIPANVAHWGEAVGECITYSIGFRAPSHADILLDFAQEMASVTTEDKRYADPDLHTQRLSGQIDHQAIERVTGILNHYAGNPTLVANWFGEYMTQPNPGGDDASLGDLDADALESTAFQLTPFARCAYFETSDHCLLFINGHRWHCSRKLAVALSEGESITLAELPPQDHYLVRHLAEEGLLDAADD